MSKSSFKTAREKLEELGYDPIEALVEIARNRNQLSEVRLRAATALLPYVYSAQAAKFDINVANKTGVMVVPGQMTEEEWEARRPTLPVIDARIIDDDAPRQSHH